MAEKISQEEGERIHDPKPAVADKPEEFMEVLGSEPEVIKFSIGEIYFAPMKVGQIRRFITEAGKLIPAINGMVMADGSINLSELQRIDQDGLMRGLAIAVNCTPAKLDEMEVPEFIRLVTKVMVVNFDFFIRAIPQVLGVVAASLQKSTAEYGVGLTLSSASSMPVIPSRT